MAWVVALKDEIQVFFPNKPSKGFLYWFNLESPNNRMVGLPKSSTNKLIDRDLCWEDNPIELMEE